MKHREKFNTLTQFLPEKCVTVYLYREIYCNLLFYFVLSDKIRLY